MANKKPTVLIILDGWGYRENQESNAIQHAKTPVLDNLWATKPKMLIQTSGMAVGLPDGQMGNSEVGHVNLGAGRIVYQDFTRITKAIADDEFDQVPALVSAVDKAVANNKAVHLCGLLSPGGVHSHEDHILAMIELAHARGAKEIYLHAFLDGRDTPPRSAENSLIKAQEKFAQLGCGQVASIIGRYYAMDRDQRWERVEAAYNLMVLGEAEYQAADAVSGLQAAYQRDENDEFVKATAIPDANGQAITVDDGDAIIFMNFRADRARQFTRAFVEQNFDGFTKKKAPALADFVMLTEYAADIDAPSAFPPEELNNVLGEWLEKHDKTQLRISETEKYAHVTFFFSGGREDTFIGEERVLIPSPQVATYDLQPEMNAPLLTDKLVAAIESQSYDFIVCNYPNGDMVGHTGNFDAAVKACEAVDNCIGRVITALENVGGECLITADHGNAEQMADNQTGQAHTAHTCEPVPLIFVGRNATPASTGALSDIAPTILNLMALPQPKEMTGSNLMELTS
ncbi:2,3-bisphosphoglycerate-independent phosphoglycerate mutase [Thalassotalea sp. PP2-459]|uniref:2,3-bisphosphoglycerate-independent phosphoglycerate mutase n=1 Tax=Thalassotalea sp. PP2-459 TaxID=1742724 RepID=UPI000943C341|nr:2,3-bisphosphoglycerate-independent phosphoglycerate mutase [Thalassotalea sp. PP2-459]OKY26816.1 phosphoglycerate mutase (2,3-diphosphoglycerate-independent) [Thalassotalea sp. PP2-459]